MRRREFITCLARGHKRLAEILKIDTTIMRIVSSGLPKDSFLTAEVGCERECHLIGL